MASRNVLAMHKLAEFQAWLTTQGIPHRPGRGEWQVLQVRIRPRMGEGWIWAAVYTTLRATEHYSVQDNLAPLVRRFIRETSGVKTTFADPNGKRDERRHRIDNAPPGETTEEDDASAPW